MISGNLPIFTPTSSTPAAPRPAAAPENSATQNLNNNNDGVELSGGLASTLEQDVAQLDRFSDRMGALSLASTVGTFLLCIVGGPAALVPALCMLGLSGVSCAVSLSSEGEARTLEEKASQIAAKSPPATLTILD